MLHAVTQLAKEHTILGIVYKEIPDGTPMGAMAGNTAHLPSAPLFRRVRLPLERMPPAARNPDDVQLVADMPVTRQAEVVDRLEQLRFVLAPMGVVAGFAHPRFDRAMYKLLFPELPLHIGMAFIAECRTALGDGVLRGPLAVMAVPAGIRAGRAVHVPYGKYPFVAEYAGVDLFIAAVHLGRRRVHDMAGAAETLFFGSMQGHRGKLRQNLLAAVDGCIKNGEGSGFDLLAAVEQIDDKFVDTRVP